MFDSVARKYGRFLIEPLARFFSYTGLSPNVVTIIGFLLTVGVTVVLAQGYFLTGGLLLIAAAMFDGVDGSLARMVKRTSRFGAFLDSTIDRYSEAVIFLGLFIYLSGQNQKLELILIYATVVGSLMVSYARARAEGIGVSVKEGLVTRFERVFILCAGLIFNVLPITLWILAILTNITAIQRMYMVWRITGGEKGG
jgi:CDP-diacylglycerol---glycerol-3-phosphate 3-phosphatidyltransferase